MLSESVDKNAFGCQQKDKREEGNLPFHSSEFESLEISAQALGLLSQPILLISCEAT